MPKGRITRRGALIEKIYVPIYQYDVDSWADMQEIAGQQSKGATLWHLATLGMTQAAQTYQERIERATRICEKLAEKADKMQDDSTKKQGGKSKATEETA